jgi:hypothetical protein
MMTSSHAINVSLAPFGVAMMRANLLKGLLMTVVTSCPVSHAIVGQDYEWTMNGTLQLIACCPYWLSIRMATGP